MWKHIFILYLGINFGLCYDMTKSNGGGKLIEIIADRIELIKESPETGEYHIKIRKANKTRAFYGYITFSQPFGTDLQLDGKLLKKQGGEYRYLPYRLPKSDFCDFLINTDKYIYPELAKSSDFPVDIANNCPLPAGNYSINGVQIDAEKAPIAMLPSGEYAYEYSFYKKDELLSQYRAYAYINNV